MLALQTKGIFALECDISDSVHVGLLLLQDDSLCGQEVSLVNSQGRDRYLVKIPSNITLDPDASRLLNAMAITDITLELANARQNTTV